VIFRLSSFRLCARKAKEKLNVRTCDLTGGEAAMWKFLILATGIGAASPIAAEDFTQRPTSCQLVSTAQFSDCSADNHFRCNDGTETYFRIESFEAEGLTIVFTETSDFLPRTLSTADGIGMYVTAAEGPHPRDMLEAGGGVQQFDADFLVFGLAQPASGRIDFSYTGEAIEMAGRTFHVLRGEVSLKLPRASIVESGKTVVGYQPEADVWVEIEFSMDSEPTIYLRDVAFQGQPGFGNAAPRYGCMSLSALPNQRFEG
jgi:hypothetical protein